MMERKKNVRVVLVMPEELKNKLQEAADNSYTQFSSWCRQRLAEGLPKDATPSSEVNSTEPKLTAKERKTKDSAEMADKMLAYITQHPGCRAEACLEALGLDAATYYLPVMDKMLINEKKVVTPDDHMGIRARLYLPENRR